MTKINLLPLFIFIATILSYTNSYADPPLPTPIARVVWIKGTLTAIMPSNEKRILQKDSVVYLKDTLITDATSHAQIVFTDNTLMSFRPDTKFVIDNYDFNPKPKKGGISKFVAHIIEGGFRTITGLIAKNNSNDYEINTPVATIGVRGTDYTVNYRSGKMYVGYLNGTTIVNNKSGKVELNEQNKYVYVPSSTAMPTILFEEPAELKEKLEITPAKIAPFTTATPSGTASSFCITQ